MAKTLYNWKSVNWEDQDIVISRNLNCSRERVRQKRLEIGADKSPKHHKRESEFKNKLKSLDTTQLTVDEMVRVVGCSRAYIVAMLTNYFTDKAYKKVDRRRGGKYEWGKADWTMTDKAVAMILGVPNPMTVTQHRRRLGIIKRKRIVDSSKEMIEKEKIRV